MAVVVEQQSRGTRFIRAFGLLALMAGIVAMHALVLGMSDGPATGREHSDHAMLAPAAMVMNQDQGAFMPGCGGDCDSGHAGMHGCLFVLTALLLRLGLALLARVGLGNRDAAATKPRHPRASNARPPPWTVLSLAELAILRI
ncbi:hypothetical protein D6158_24045 [Nocardia seriolae]|nr:hypothetical protein D6158_24045 [Nocardia seriolae]